MKQDYGFQRCEFWQISRCAGRYSDQVWKSTTWFSEEWKISLIAMYTVLGTIKKWQWHGFLHGNLSSLIRIYHKNFWTAIFFMGEILLPAREVVRLLQKAWVSRQKREISHVWLLYTVEPRYLELYGTKNKVQDICEFEISRVNLLRK